MRSVKTYSGVGAVARCRQESEGAAETKSHHGNFAVTPRMLLEIGDHVGKVSHADLEIVPVVACKGAFATLIGPGQRARISIAPEHVGGGGNKSFGRKSVSVIRHVTVDAGNG